MRRSSEPWVRAYVCVCVDPSWTLSVCKDPCKDLGGYGVQCNRSMLLQELPCKEWHEDLYYISLAECEDLV